MKIKFCYIVFLLAALFGPACDQALSQRLPRCEHAACNAISIKPKQAGVVSAHHLASQAGQDILAQGGNAFDAAVAVAATLSVVEGHSSGIGGGGFFLLRMQNGSSVFVDAREVAPQAARMQDYLDEAGQFAPEKSINGALAAGIPGEPAAWVHIAKKYGRLPLKKSLAPAIKIARGGFPVYERYKNRAQMRLNTFKRDAYSTAIFVPGGVVPEIGTIIKQNDLADTLERIAKYGNKGFYRGPMAKKLVDGVRKNGGNWSLDDLARYQIKERAPLLYAGKNYQLVTAPPPSSGGVMITNMLNVLSGFDWKKLNRVQRVHLLTEVMRRAYRDRSVFLGDPDFVSMPIDRLTSMKYADELRASIKLDRATPSKDLVGGPIQREAPNTTHFSIIDRDGNMVSATQTVNLPFGAALAIEGTGVLLNNEMDDFSIVPGSANAFGLIGDKANAIEPGKRMLSSMTPTIYLDQDRIVVLGTPGGSRIVSMVMLGLLAAMEGQMPTEFVAAPRFHHQYLPDVLSAEKGTFTREERQALQALGHVVSDGESPWGNMQALLWSLQDNQLHGGSDPRSSAGKAIIN